MASTTHTTVPTVVIYNNLETFYQFLNRAEDKAIIENRLYRGDRALLWMGSTKLVFVTAHVQHLSYLTTLGYTNTICLVPEQPSPWLSLDILREASLIMQLVAYAGSEGIVQLVPYATTPQFLQLADV